MNERKKLRDLCNTVMALSVEIGRIIERGNLAPEDKHALENVLDVMTMAVYDDFNELNQDGLNGDFE